MGWGGYSYGTSGQSCRQEGRAVALIGVAHPRKRKNNIKKHPLVAGREREGGAIAQEGNFPSTRVPAACAGPPRARV